MSPQERVEFWTAFVLMGIPIIGLAYGSVGPQFLILLGALAALASHPLIALAAIMLYGLRVPLRLAAEPSLSARRAGSERGSQVYFRARKEWKE